MYSIGHVVYGYSLYGNREFHKKLEELEADENSDWYEGDNYKIYDVIDIPYHGGASEVGWIGLEIFEFDECNHYNLLTSPEIRDFKITPEMEAEVDKMVAKLPDSLRELLGDRGLWITWSSS